MTMKSRMQRTLGAVFCLVFISVTVEAVAAQETAGQILAKLNDLAPEEREKVLLEKAKSEGEATIYSAMNQDELDPFTKAFQKRFPFVKINALRIAGQRQEAKIQAEFRAGAHLVDIVNTRSAIGYTLEKAGILDPYHSPQRKFFPASYVDKRGYFAPLFVIPVVLGYNSGLVRRDEAPKSYQDLLDPKWKGKMSLDTEDYEWFAVLMEHFGREKGLDYMRTLARQDLSMLRGRTLQTQLVIAGERPVAISLHGHSVLEFKDKGAPIDWTVLDPYYSKANVITLARYAPHPHAAALFIDWALSEEAQSVVAALGRVAARNGVKQRFPALTEREYRLVDPDMIGPVLGRSTKEYQEIFMGGR